MSGKCAGIARIYNYSCLFFPSVSQLFRIHASFPKLGWRNVNFSFWHSKGCCRTLLIFKLHVCTIVINYPFLKSIHFIEILEFYCKDSACFCFRNRFTCCIRYFSIFSFDCIFCVTVFYPWKIHINSCTTIIIIPGNFPDSAIINCDIILC